MTSPVSLDFFCHVIDNFGDAGVCWRLIRQLKNEYGFRITLWISHLPTLPKIGVGVNPGKEIQEIEGIQVRHWHPGDPAFSSEEAPLIPDVVIEGFGCSLPVDYIAAMARRNMAPVWINLEYLSAETWVEDCHKMVSPQSSTSLRKYFFFPGFSSGTGGLLREKNLVQTCTAFQKNRETGNNFLNSLGLNTKLTDCKILLFCYKSAPVKALFDCLQKNEHQPVFCIVPEDVASDAVSYFLKQPAVAGARTTQGALTVQVLPMIAQDDFDRLLWSCDLNFVRGEDSFLRAQWAAKPFVWHIYPQEDNAHHDKLNAFLELYLPMLAPEEASIVKRFWYLWNGIEEDSVLDKPLWDALASKLPGLGKRGESWLQKLTANADLASNLVRFIQVLG